MNKTVSFLRHFLRQAFGVAVLLAGGTTCDNFEPDELKNVAAIAALGNISLYENSDAIINIADRITSPVRLRITCEQNPTKGYLESLSNGNFRYTPYMNTVGSDELTFSIRGLEGNEEILPRQKVVLNIKEVPFPPACPVIAVSDIATSRQVQPSFPIFVATNDLICATDYRVVVYKPSPAFMPHYGIVSLNSETDPNNSSTLYYRSTLPEVVTDTVMYKIIDLYDPTNVAYGLVYIAPESCQTLARSEMIFLDETGTVHVDLLENDDLCFDPADDYVSVQYTQPPKHGKFAEDTYQADGWDYPYVPGFIWYQDTARNAWTYDTIGYSVCYDKVELACYSAQLVISKVPRTCATEAVYDRVHTNDAEPVTTIDVLKNDNYCSQQPKLFISIQPQHGTVEIDAATNTIRYTAKRKLNDSFQYFACIDNFCERAMVSILAN